MQSDGANDPISPEGGGMPNSELNICKCGCVSRADHRFTEHALHVPLNCVNHFAASPCLIDQCIMALATKAM
jgi:hypothetical protein